VCIDIQEIISQYGSPIVIIDNRHTINAAFLGALVNLAIQKEAEYSALPVQNKCDTINFTKYDYASVETIMLMTGLISLSWLSINIKKKTEDGHCHNPTHELKNGHPYCEIGSKFHRKLFDDLVRILQELTGDVKACTPNVIE
jgi:hypothetical protein